MATPQESFGQLLDRVAGQAFRAAGYHLEETPLHHARGLFRYRKPLDGEILVYIEFQLLHYEMGGRSRFRVNLLRNIGKDARANTNYAERVDITLSKLLWDIFKVEYLESADHWWLFNNPNELGHGLADAGKLVIGFGIPWLEGTLKPDLES